MDKLPEKLSAKKFREAYGQLANAKFYKSVVDDRWYCKACNSLAGIGVAHVSIHDYQFPFCAGGGAVRKVPYLGCPKCEPSSTTMYTCVHLTVTEELQRVPLLPDEFKDLG